MLEFFFGWISLGKMISGCHNTLLTRDCEDGGQCPHWSKPESEAHYGKMNDVLNGFWLHSFRSNFLSVDIIYWSVEYTYIICIVHGYIIDNQIKGPKLVVKPEHPDTCWSI